MKKSGIFLITTLVATNSLLAAPIKIHVNGREISSPVAPIVKSGTTLVPLRVISEELGALVDWSSTTNNITIYSTDANLELKMGALTMTKVDFASDMETQIPLALAPIQVNYTTMVPLRAISEGLGCKVDYVNGFIHITSETSISQPETSLFTEETQRSIQDLLTTQYDTCSTMIGDIHLTYEATFNKDKLTYYPCDFEIVAKLSDEDLAHLNDLTANSPDTALYVKNQLKEHINQLALELISTYPEAKFWGYYDLSHYKLLGGEPTLFSTYTCTWMNYIPDADLTYAGSKKDIFNWFTSYDTEIW